MGIRIKTKQTLKILLILSWILFTGLCIEAFGFIFNAVFALANPAVVRHLWQQVDLSDLFQFNHGYFFVAALIISVVTGLKAWLFFRIIKILHSKNLDMAQPFRMEIRHFILHLSYISLLIGLFSIYGVQYMEWLVSQGLKMPDTKLLHLDGADVWLFMAVILFVIAQIFKRGIEIQAENELTI